MDLKFKNIFKIKVSFGMIACLLIAIPPSEGLAQNTAAEPVWGYAITAPRIDPERLFSLPGSDLTFTISQIRNIYAPADWYPQDHPVMPNIVAFGREQEVWACSGCHYPNGKGRPENAGIAGLPESYFVQQLHDFRDGLRKSAQLRKHNTNTMGAISRMMTEDEIQAAAEYFGSMSWTQWIRVIETDTVPKTRISGGMYLRLEGEEAGTEPIGQRIVETPENTEHTELLRDPRSGFIAYVPVGSIAKGESLARNGESRTLQCAICHGENLEGLGFVPGLRGRSPSYVARQLYDFQMGTRQGAFSALMTPVVENLTSEDVLNLSAYVASLAPTEY
jgi:cytochrome c553